MNKPCSGFRPEGLTIMVDNPSTVVSLGPIVPPVGQSLMITLSSHRIATFFFFWPMGKIK